MRQTIVSILTAATVFDATLPQIPAQETPTQRDPIPTEQKSVAVDPNLVEQVIHNYRSSIREIYLANGKPETLLPQQIDTLTHAIREVCQKLDPNFKSSHFDKASLFDKIETVSTVLNRHGFIVGSLDKVVSSSTLAGW